MSISCRVMAQVSFGVCCLALFVSLNASGFASGQKPNRQKLDGIYHSAAADFDAGRFPAAAQKLESVLPYATKSYEVHELLGMAYASMSENAKAEEHLKLAVQLNPDSAAARTNFGALLMHAGKPALASEQFRKALQVEPQNFDANRDLALCYLQSGKIADALPLLETAQRIHPGSYDNGYDLALAYLQSGRLSEARKAAQADAAIQNTGEIHNLLGQINEKDGQFVAAANEYEAAAHLDPSDDNLFAWGSEMLLHRTYEPAITLFQEATHRYPKSPRLFIGLGLALYSRGIYDEAVQALLTAADLNPADPRCYVFLSKAYDASPKLADRVTDAFRRYEELRPSDALAKYYLAMSIWKGNRATGSTTDLPAVESLLLKSIDLNGSDPDVHLQLGEFYSSQHQYEKAIPEYQRSIAIDPDISDAHYRLGTDYVHIGKKDEAQQEFAVYQRLRAQHLAEIEKERAEVQQFVYSEKGGETPRQ
ncbi:MAG TPA: tetratricopeptide repeat protein [Terracidiphilus sp.]